MIRRRATLLLGVVGLALLGAAAARVIYTSSGAGIVTLLIIGAVLLVSPFVIARVERMSINSGGFGLQLTRELADAGAPNTARILEHADLGRFAEAYAVVRKAGYRPATLLGLAGTVSLMLAVYEKGPTAYPLVLSLFMIFSFLWYLVRVEAARPTVNVAVTALAFLWTAGLGSFAALSLTLPNRQGIALILLAVVGTVAYDVGGLFFGSQMGSRPLLPEISPNKTWEGLIGGCMSAVVFCAIVGGLVKPWSLSRGIVLGLVVAVAAPLGDLCQSMIKRDIGIKDMGSILPGHGGVLDRVDALLFVLPAAYYLGLLLHFNNVIR